MECAQIEITGGSGSASPELVSIPGVYPVSCSHPRSLTALVSADADEGMFNRRITPVSSSISIMAWKADTRRLVCAASPPIHCDPRD